MSRWLRGLSIVGDGDCGGWRLWGVGLSGMGVVGDGDCGGWGLLEVECVIWRHRLELGG